jgi:hypothetical protein
MNKDALYHIFLGIGLCLTLLVILLLPKLIAIAIIVAFILYFRELTQVQSKLYDGDIRRGWNFTEWSVSKNVETWVPIGVILIMMVFSYVIY